MAELRHCILEILDSFLNWSVKMDVEFNKWGIFMEKRVTTAEQIKRFCSYLQLEEREPGTIEKYLREVRVFLIWAGEREVNKDLTTAWKEHLKSQHFQPETVNAKLSALNKFLRFLGLRTAGCAT